MAQKKEVLEKQADNFIYLVANLIKRIETDKMHAKNLFDQLLETTDAFKRISLKAKIEEVQNNIASLQTIIKKYDD